MPLGQHVENIPVPGTVYTYIFVCIGIVYKLL